MIRSIIMGCLIIALAVMVPACYSKEKAFEKGQALAHQYCQSCHLFPDPVLATKLIWLQHILPSMGPRLGIRRFEEVSYPAIQDNPELPRHTFPDSPLLTQEDWALLVKYYQDAAPDSLRDQQSRGPYPVTTRFEIRQPLVNYSDPVTTLVKIDTLSHLLFQADYMKRMLFVFDPALSKKDSIKTQSTPVDLILQPSDALLCNIGNINPNDGITGSLQDLPRTVSGKAQLPYTLFADLRRPVEIRECDLNGDGQNDLIVCEYGNVLGALSWLENTGHDQYRRHVIQQTPGAIHVEVQDVNQDGRPDVWALFAQGNESLVLFTNRGNGRFDARTILQFPSIYGSSSFSLVDFNGDGYTDILYTAGDNGDYSQINKPYHGIYIFLNDGHQHFTRQYFFPMHGCYKAIARDFDGDGDLDIAAIAYFADYARHPDEGFVYLENKGALHFEPFSLPAARVGRWLTMDAGDLDGDGQPDLVLGNFSYGPVLSKPAVDWSKGPAFLVLRNRGHR